MANAAPYRQGRDYLRSKVETASRTQLVLMLYDGAIRFLSLGRERMMSGAREEQNHFLCRGQRIIGELMATLNHDSGGDISANLRRLYIFMLQRLVEANVQDDPHAVEEVIEMLRDLRLSWEQIDCQSTGEREAQVH